jgi:hypothetical protein
MPLHQVPAQVVAVERLPLTDSGKINRPALSGAPLARLLHAFTRLLHASYMPLTRLRQPTPLIRLLHASYILTLTRLLQARLSQPTPHSFRLSDRLHASYTPLAHLLHASSNLHACRSLRRTRSASPTGYVHASYTPLARLLHVS